MTRIDLPALGAGPGLQFDWDPDTGTLSGRDAVFMQLAISHAVAEGSVSSPPGPHATRCAAPCTGLPTWHLCSASSVSWMGSGRRLSRPRANRMTAMPMRELPDTSAKPAANDFSDLTEGIPPATAQQQRAALSSCHHIADGKDGNAIYGAGAGPHGSRLCV